ncbi:hypothetical protein [Rhizorhabdus dicambivorans]|uniref:hypothetical protein n=1 Tax=Rhizorhabdus dicambivorans TaxID=1850238 RepID=UPI0018653E20|nr:hypothetical protein [Rhizorhabdus dicambivorans]
MSRRRLISMAGIGAMGAGLLSQGYAAAAPQPRASPPSPLPWPERGSFGGQAIVGAHQSSAAAMVDDRTYFGLPRERTFFYGNLRDAEGNLYEVVRGIAGQGFGGLDTLFVQSSEGQSMLRVLPAIGAAAAPSNGAKGRLEGDMAVWSSAPSSPGKPFRITMNADGSEASWLETDVLDVRGRLLGPGLQWHVADRDGSEFYVSQIYEMAGTLMGRQVRGILALDQSYLPQGMLMYSGQDPLFRADQHHRCWYTWATRYTDGSYDSGHFVLGTERVGFALFTNQRGETNLSTKVSGSVKLIPGDIWPETIQLDVDGEKWEFLPDPKGRMPDLLYGKIQSITPQNEGRWQRVGERRTPAVWFAWGEVQSNGRIDYRQTKRI